MREAISEMYETSEAYVVRQEGGPILFVAGCGTLKIKIIHRCLPCLQQEAMKIT